MTTSSKNSSWFFIHSKIEDKGYIVMLWLDISVITHEIVHLVAQLCDSRWIVYRSENDEVIAYLSQYYMSEIIKWFGINIWHKNKKRI
jgi:hypothetical protein